MKAPIILTLILTISSACKSGDNSQKVNLSPKSAECEQQIESAIKPAMELRYELILKMDQLAKTYYENPPTQAIDPDTQTPIPYETSYCQGIYGLSREKIKFDLEGYFQEFEVRDLFNAQDCYTSLQNALHAFGGCEEQNQSLINYCQEPRIRHYPQTSAQERSPKSVSDYCEVH